MEDVDLSDTIAPNSEQLNADDLMAGSDLGSPGRQIAFGQVQVGATHPAARHGYPDLTGSGYRGRPLDPPQRPLVDRRALLHHPRLHGPPIPSLARPRIHCPGIIPIRAGSGR